MPFYFSAYSSLLLLGVVQAVVFAVLLLRRAQREGHYPDVFAALILLVGALFVSQWMLGFAGWYDRHDGYTTLMFYTEWNHLAALGPLIWLYFRAATNADFRWRRRHWLHFLPWLLLLLPHLLAFAYDFAIHCAVYGQSFTHFHGTRGPAQELLNAKSGLDDLLETIIVWVQLSVYLWWTLRDYRRYRRYLREEFSNTAPLELRGLRMLLLLFVGGLTVLLLTDVATGWLVSSTYVSEWYRFLAMAVLMYAAAIQFYGVRPEWLRSVRFVEPADTPLPAPTEPALQPLWQVLEERMRKRRDYLEPDLRLHQLADRLGTTPELLSRTINTLGQANFNDYVNGYRCAAFLNRLRAGDHRTHTLLGLALDSGFNSKSTFNRAFRKCCDCSPGEAVKRLEKGFGTSQKMI